MMTPRRSPRQPVPVPDPARRAVRGAVVASLLAVCGLAACGDDDTDADPSSTTVVASSPDTTPGTNPGTNPGTDAPDGGIEGVCDDYATITGGFLAGQADPAEAPAVLDRFADQAPAEIADAAARIRDGLTAVFGGDESAFADPEFTGALSAAGDHLFSVCPSAAAIEVGADDYAFAGLPDEVPAGRLAVRFVNTSDSGEPHELILLRRPEGDTTPVDELAMLGMDEMMSSYQMAGVVFADQPDIANTALLDLDAGSYVAICTIPVTGSPTTSHAMVGMIAALEVTP